MLSFTGVQVSIFKIPDECSRCKLMKKLLKQKHYSIFNYMFSKLTHLYILL